MPIFSIWESHFPNGAAVEGRELTEAIWRDMTTYQGYLWHQLIQDADDPGHLLVISRWTSREHADAVLHDYANHANAMRPTNWSPGRVGASSPNSSHPNPRYARRPIMRAVGITRFGDADALELLEIAEPEVDPGEVAIDVEYAGVNFAPELDGGRHA